MARRERFQGDVDQLSDAEEEVLIEAPLLPDGKGDDEPRLGLAREGRGGPDLYEAGTREDERADLRADTCEGGMVGQVGQERVSWLNMHPGRRGPASGTSAAW